MSKTPILRSGATLALGQREWVRGSDAVQLASALSWRESVGEEIVVATFDQQLWEAARRIRLKAWPDDVLPPDTR